MPSCRSLAAVSSPDATTREPPTEIKLFGFGTTRTRKGDFELTPDSAKEVMANYVDHVGANAQADLPLMLDFEHKSLDPAAPPEQMRAAGWGRLELRDDGIWLSGVRWTEEAENYLRSGQFRYISPAFLADEKTRAITEILNVALTNLPATDELPALVAASRMVPEDDDSALWFLATAKRVMLTAVPFKSAPVRQGAWDGDAATDGLRKWASSDGSGAKEKIDWSKYESGFAIVRGSGDNFGDYLLPHHAIVDGVFVTSASGVQAAGGVLQGARGGVHSVSDADLEGAKRHLEQHYHQWGATAPWEPKKESQMNPFQTKLKTAADKNKLSVAQLCAALGIDKTALKRFALGAMPTTEEMKAMAAHAKSVGRLDIFDNELETAPIDASLNGGDVNDLGYKDDDSASGIFGTSTSSSSSSGTSTSGSSSSGTSTSGSSNSLKSSSSSKTQAVLRDESIVNVAGDEANENRGGSSSATAIAEGDFQKAIDEAKLARDRQTKEILTLTGGRTEDEARGTLLAWRDTAKRYDEDHAELVKLREERITAERLSLIEHGKLDGKLTPALIDFFKGRPNAELKAFLLAAPRIQPNELSEIAPGGNGATVLDFNKDEALVEQLMPSGDPREFVALRNDLAGAREGSVVHAGRGAAFKASILSELKDPKSRPGGWKPRSELRMQ